MRVIRIRNILPNIKATVSGDCLALFQISTLKSNIKIWNCGIGVLKNNFAQFAECPIFAFAKITSPYWRWADDGWGGWPAAVAALHRTVCGVLVRVRLLWQPPHDSRVRHLLRGPHRDCLQVHQRGEDLTQSQGKILIITLLSTFLIEKVFFPDLLC